MRRQRINPGICDQRERLEQFEPCLKLVKQKTCYGQATDVQVGGRDLFEQICVEVSQGFGWESPTVGKIPRISSFLPLKMLA